MKVLQYPEHIGVYHGREPLIEYKLPPHGVKNQKFYSRSAAAEAHEPRDRKNPTGEEEKILRGVSETAWTPT